MKLVSLTVALFAFSTLIGADTAFAVTADETAAGNSDGAQQVADPDGSAVNVNTADDSEGAGSFSIIVPQQDNGQLQFGGSSVLPNFPSDGNSQ